LSITDKGTVGLILVTRVGYMTSLTIFGALKKRSQYYFILLSNPILYFGLLFDAFCLVHHNSNFPGELGPLFKPRSKLVDSFPSHLFKQKEQNKNKNKKQ